MRRLTYIKGLMVDCVMSFIQKHKKSLFLFKKVHRFVKLTL